MRVSRLNYEAPQQAGSITFTDPKLYRREALINERRQEIAYLDTLLKSSETQAFSPEIIRELEVVSSLSASLGLRFDPAAGANNRRDDETAEIQQEIRTLKLQLELDQLRRDAQLFKKGLEEQQAVSNTNLGKPREQGQDAASTVAPPTVTELMTAITALQTALQTRLGSSVPAPRASLAAINPIDTFQDRSAYRNLLNSAKNAANLDELHDKDGSALLRLYFSATVLPPQREYIDTLGMLRMEVIEPRFNYGDVERVYRAWLSYVNRNMNLYRDFGGAGHPKNKLKLGSLSENPAFLPFVGAGDLFDSVEYYYQPVGSAASCPVIVFPSAELADELVECGQLTFAVPRPRNLLASEGYGDSRYDSAALYANLTGRREILFKEFYDAARALRTYDARSVFDQSCLLLRNNAALREALDAALTTYFISGVLSEIELQARKTLSDNGFEPPPPSKIFADFSQLNSAAGALINELIMLGTRREPVCTVYLIDYMRTHVPTRFFDGFRSRQRIAIYEVGPREQVQQVSTVARAADAIGLAAAIAGQVPTRGLGMSGSLAYARSATGKADALERVPLAVAFAEAGSEAGRDETAVPPAFGWLLGPRVSVDPKKQRLLLEHQLRPYDLSVDLSVPGWWPYVNLKAETAWAPNWRGNGGKTITGLTKERTIRIELSPNSADMAALTNILSGYASVRLSTISDIFPKSISACARSTELQIIGDNIWRTNTVIIAGRKFEGNLINILPDMNGIRVTLDTAIFPAIEQRTSAAVATVTALTPYGRATGELTVTEAKPDGSCKAIAQTEERGAPS